MRKAPSVRIAIKAALFYFTVAGLCHTIHAQSQVPFRLVHNTLIVVSVTANGIGPFEFILDTGADTTIIDPGIASELSLSALDRVHQTTLASTQSLSRAALRSLSLGPAQIEDMPILVQDLASLRSFDPHIVGIAGQDFLSHFNYLIDYPRLEILMEGGREIRDNIEGERLPFESGKNRILLPSEGVSSIHASLHLLLDTGANSLVLLPSASQSLRLPAQSAGIERTSSGQVAMQVGRVQELAVGPQRFHDIVAALPSVEPAEQVGDGLLPASLFKSLYINNREGFVILNPRHKKN